MKKKYMIIYTVLWLLILLTCYLFVSFVEGNVNLVNWQKKSKLFLVLIVSIINGCFAALGTTYDR